MYLIIILTAFMYRNKFGSIYEYKHFSYVTPAKIESCLLDADFNVFIAKSVALLKTRTDDDNYKINAANTLAHYGYGNVYHQTSTRNMDPFQKMQTSLQHINLSYLENVGHHKWYREIKIILSTVTTQDVIDVTIKLLICVLSEVYAASESPSASASESESPSASASASASASPSASNSICAISGGKRRRKTKYRKTRKNKLSKKTHRRSRK